MSKIYIEEYRYFSIYIYIPQYIYSCETDFYIYALTHTYTHVSFTYAGLFHIHTRLFYKCVSLVYIHSVLLHLHLPIFSRYI